MKTVQYSVLTGLCLLCFLSFTIMIRECQNLNQFQFTFLWACMCISALLSLVIMKAMEESKK